MNAEELHAALKIETPFREWSAAQIKAGKPLKPFFGKLADGKLGKNYTMTPELEAELVAQHAPKPIEQPAASKINMQIMKIAARGLPVVETPATPTEISKKKRRKIEQLLANKERRERNRQAISDRVDAMPIENAQQRLLEVKGIIEGITRDLLSYKKGVTDIPKMIESGLRPKEWAHRAGLARGYLLLERRLILNKLKPPKQEALDAEFNEIVREIESKVDVDNSVIDNNPGNNS